MTSEHTPDELLDDRRLLLREVTLLSKEVGRLSSEASNLSTTMLPRAEAAQRRNLLIAVAVVIAAVVGAVAYFFNDQQNDLDNGLQEFRQSAADSCVKRNAAQGVDIADNGALQTLLMDLSKAEAQGSAEGRPARLAAFGKYLAYLESKPTDPSPVDCSKYVR